MPITSRIIFWKSSSCGRVYLNAIFALRDYSIKKFSFAFNACSKKPRSSNESII